jgi:hypothetical protein
MSPIARRARSAAALAVLTLGGTAAAAPFAAASVTSAAGKVPFNDPGIDGWLTFCNRSDKPVTSGSLYTTPFAWKIIASAKPPAGYGGPTGRATLYAFQPIQYVDPGDWSGGQLTAASGFTNPDHPVVQATNLDQPLIGFTGAYPAHWQGLVEIRMLFTAVDKAQLQIPYPAAILRVSGTKWTLVEGGGGSCSQGQGVSMETKALSKKELAKPRTAAPATKSQAAAAGKSAGSAGGSGSGQSAGGSNAGSAANLAAAGSSTGLNWATLAGAGVGAFALVWIGMTVIARLRRRAAS